LEKVAGQEDPVIADALLTPESVAIVGATNAAQNAATRRFAF
jgi:hypothetical protein